jgi:flavin-dependent dehydrogenase
MYDVIVLGARCAGAPTAMLLARKGWRVLLVDRAKFPRDIPHGHFIHRDGPRRLAAWGLLERVARYCPPVTAFTLDLGDFPLTATDLVADGIAFGYAPRRTHLDHVLVDAAIEAGVEVRQGFSVESIVFDGGRVAGIRGREEGRTTAVIERARATIGADGRRSTLAAAVHAPEYDAQPTATCWYFSYWSGVDARGLEVYVRGHSMTFAFPTSDNRHGVFFAYPATLLAEIKSNIEGHIEATLDRIPDFAARIRAGRREEPFRGATDLPNFFRKPYGAGWALVGDAGMHKDPYLALGICDAFRDVDMLVEALDAGLAGRREMEPALADYERRRNDDSRDDYWQNLSGARFEPPPAEFMRLRAALRGNPEATRQFFLARERMIPAAGVERA